MNSDQFHSKYSWVDSESHLGELDYAARDDEDGCLVLVGRSAGPVQEALHIPRRKAAEGRVVEDEHGPCSPPPLSLRPMPATLALPATSSPGVDEKAVKCEWL